MILTRKEQVLLFEHFLLNSYENSVTIYDDSTYQESYSMGTLAQRPSYIFMSQAYNKSGLIEQPEYVMSIGALINHQLPINFKQNCLLF
jgi:hypothetical protein